MLLLLKRPCDRTLGVAPRRAGRPRVVVAADGRRKLLGQARASEKEIGRLRWVRKAFPTLLGQLGVSSEVGPTLALYRCIPTGMHGPTCIFWVNLTPFSPQAWVRSTTWVHSQANPWFHKHRGDCEPPAFAALRVLLWCLHVAELTSASAWWIR